MKKNGLLIGAHVSIAGGFDQAIVRGEKIGATCIQIFTKNNRQWKSKKITQQQADAFTLQQKNSSIKVVVAHAAYLINLGSTNKLVVEKSVHALVDELERCDMLRIPYLVLHPGTLKKDDEQNSLEFIAEHINKVLQQAQPKHVTLLLETMAGQGSVAGHTFEQLATIIKHIKHKRYVGVCIDTCHIFAAGYLFDTPATYKKLWQQFDQTIGLEKLKVFHFNDSKKETGSRVDRHEHIGKGKIGAAAFKLLMNDARFADVAKILETPKGQDEFTDDIKNLETLRSLVKK